MSPFGVAILLTSSVEYPFRGSISDCPQSSGIGSLCLSVLKIGVRPVLFDWSRTSAELPYKVHCTFGSAGNLLTHPVIYGSSDPEGIPPFSEGKRNEFQKTDFEILRSVE
ncbi:hypothetical protein TNCV_1476811 [Trichonephila clavipes]|nr:hypothetical protein TNCV_1476811 [Trichonephila clavipes]